MPRRASLGFLAGLGLLASGCGFTMRQEPRLPFERIFLKGFDARSRLAEELRRRLGTGVRLVPAPEQAQVVLTAVEDQRQRGVVASTAAGQTREIQLRIVFSFKLDTPDGRGLIAPTVLRASRDMSFSERDALAKAQEEAELFAAMQADIVSQLLRRLVVAPAP